MNNLQKYLTKKDLTTKLAEAEAVQRMKGGDKHTGARAMTSVIPSTALGAGLGASIGSLAGGKGALLGGAAGGALGLANMVIPRVILARAARGRAAAGDTGTTKNEQDVLNALRASGNTSGTNSISRALTSSTGQSLMGAGLGGSLGARMGGAKGALAGGVLGALGGLASAKSTRELYARSLKGRAATNSGTVGGSEKAITRALQQASA